MPSSLVLIVEFVVTVVDGFRLIEVGNGVTVGDGVRLFDVESNVTLSERVRLLNNEFILGDIVCVLDGEFCELGNDARRVMNNGIDDG